MKEYREGLEARKAALAASREAFKESREQYTKACLDNASAALMEFSPEDIVVSKNVLHIDFKDRQGNWVLRFQMGDKFIQTRLGKLHNNVTQRAKKDGSFQKFHNTYNGVTISDEFSDAQKFCDWAVQQPGWGMGYVLEKDLLSPNCKIYCAESCVFVPNVINYAIINKGDSTVVRKTSQGFDVKFQAENLPIFLGTYPTKGDAQFAYKKYRMDYVKKLAKSYENFISDKAYDALIHWEPS
jgi:hypothetical protein